MLTVKPKMNHFLMWPSFKDGLTTFQPMQVVDIKDDRYTVRSPYDFDDVHEFAFYDVMLGTNRFDSELRMATDIERLDAVRAAIHAHQKHAYDAAQLQRKYNKCIDDLTRLESHLPQVLQEA